MSIKVVRVKEYNSSYKHILMVDGLPLVATKSKKRMSTFLQYLEGYDVEINDGAIKKRLDKYRKVA